MAADDRSSSTLGLMDSRWIVLSAALIAGFTLPRGVAAGAVPQVDLLKLEQYGREHIGHSIRTHGCLVHGPHGPFLQPCHGKITWREILIICDPRDLIFHAFANLGADLSEPVEADIAGTVRDEENRNGAGRHLVLWVDAIANARQVKP